MRICNFITKYMGVLVLLMAALTLFVPQTLNWAPLTWLAPLLGIALFGMGLTLNPQDFKVVFTRPKDILIGTVAQFVIMPGTAWLLTEIFSLPTDIAIGVILVGCCPGGMASNVMTFLAKGDLALSVAITSISTLLAPILTPLLTLWLAGKYVNVDAASMLLSIVQVVILPIILGFATQKLFPNFTRKAVNYMPALSSLAIIMIVGIVVSNSAAKLMHSGLLVIIVVILHNLCGLCLGYFSGKMLRLSRKKCIAISIEVGMQNSGLASSLAALHFASSPLAVLPGAVFTIWHNLSGAMIAHFFARHSKEEEK